MPDVYLHAGAHRTGTSSFQQMLAQNRPALMAQGYSLAYPGRDGAPEGRLKLRLPAPRHADADLPEFIRRARRQIARHLAPGAGSLILSEENIPGRMLHFRKGWFFPDAARRAAVTRAALPGPLRHLIYVVRDYEGLFLSSYRKRAEDGPVEPFEDNRANYMAISSGWPELLRHLTEGLQPERVTVVEYAARGTSVSLLRRLVPELPRQLCEPAQAVNRSATDTALRALQEVYARGEALPETQRRSIIAAHAKDRAPRGLAAFSAAESATLADRYARDLERLAHMPGIRFVSEL